jgi:histone H3/H4
MAIAGDVTINALNVGGENMSHSDGVAMREKLRTMIQSLLSKNVKQIKGNLIDGAVELTKKKKKKTIDVEVADD